VRRGALAPLVWAWIGSVVQTGMEVKRKGRSLSIVRKVESAQARNR
jgi:hypothetical protein